MHRDRARATFQNRTIVLKISSCQAAELAVAVHSRVKLGKYDRQTPRTTKWDFWAGTGEANQPSEEEGSQSYLTEVCSEVLVVVVVVV